jgi:biotin operon repressor
MYQARSAETAVIKELKRRGYPIDRDTDQHHTLFGAI